MGRRAKDGRASARVVDPDAAHKARQHVLAFAGLSSWIVPRVQ